MHKAICSQCKKECEVPFRPSGDRPVFCNDCFKSQGGASAQKHGGGGGNDRQHFSDKQMFQATCVKCGNKCEVPFRPTGERPVYCGQCFGKGGSAPAAKGQSSDQYREQLIMVNAKLDKILKILNPSASSVVMPETKAPEKIKEVKKEKAAVAKIKIVSKKGKAKTKK